jgi:predicted ATP-binding protein involved in virulence
MKLSYITIENFRAIKKLILPLDSQLTVLHGNNAEGKTTILDAIAVGLGAILKRMPNVTGKDFRLNDLRQESAILNNSSTDKPFQNEVNKAPFVRVTLESTKGIIWDRTKKRDQTAPTKKEIPPEKKLGELYTFLDNVINNLQNGNFGTQLPIIAYYSNDRVVSPKVQQQLHANPHKDFNRFGALESALEAISSFHNVFEWFTVQENYELREIKSRQDWNYQLPVLVAIRQSICKMLPGCSNPRTTSNPTQFIVDFEDEEGKQENLSLDQLSDGYRTMLALIMDLARRMAQANPQLGEKAIESEAIVLIDEIDLHLHPKWQQHVLVDLKTTFPNTQFIVTTHSSQVLTTIKPTHITKLQRDKGTIIAKPTDSYSFGAKSGKVLTRIMGVDERPPNEFTHLLNDYYELIENNLGESEDALKLRQQLNELSGDDPELISAKMEIRRRRALYGSQQ